MEVFRYRNMAKSVSHLSEGTVGQQQLNVSGPSVDKVESSFRGVDRHANRWRALITAVKGEKRVLLGRFEEEEEAARAYDSAAFFVHKE